MRTEALSSDGFIISQDNTSDIPYGRMNSDYNGCGWIAAYNYLKIMGRPQAAEDISAQLAAGSPFRCMLGTGPLRLRRFLEGMGCVFLAARTRAGAVRLARHARAGIILYVGGPGLHFVAFERLRGERLRFFNAQDGDAHHEGTMADFLGGQLKVPFFYLMVST